MALNAQLQALQKRIDTQAEYAHDGHIEFRLVRQLAGRGCTLMEQAGENCEEDREVVGRVTRMANLVDEMFLLEADHPVVKRYEEFWDRARHEASDWGEEDEDEDEDEYEDEDWGEEEVGFSILSDFLVHQIYNIGREEPKSAEAFVTDLLERLEAERKNQIKHEEQMANRKKKDRERKKKMAKIQKTKTKIRAWKKAKEGK